MGYTINGSAASLAPIKQSWADVLLGLNLSGRGVYRSTKDGMLEFDSCPPDLYQQWESALDAASGGSVTLSLLNTDKSDFISFKVYPQLSKRPDFVGGIANGPWSIYLRGAARVSTSGAMLLETASANYLMQEDDSLLVFE